MLTEGGIAWRLLDKLFALVGVQQEERRQRAEADATIGQRAFEVARIFRDWLDDPALSARDNLTVWVDKVARGLARVETLYGEMLERRSRASAKVSASVTGSYERFMAAARFINHHGQPQRTGSGEPRTQALEAKAKFEDARSQLLEAVSVDLKAGL